MDYSPWCGKELDMTKQLTLSLEITSAGKGVENVLLMGMQIGSATMENSIEIP